jgi:hypothetical protein
LKYFYGDIPRKCFRNFYKWEGSTYVNFNSLYHFIGEESNNIELQGLFQMGILTNKGLYLSDDEECDRAKTTNICYPIWNIKYTTTNTFPSFSEIKLGTTVNEQNPQILYGSEKPEWFSYEKIIETNIAQVKVQNVKYPGDLREFKKAIVKLTKPDDNLLDKIHIAKVVKLPFQDKDVIIDLYPLSTLYKEWKADKDARRPVRSGVKWHGIRPEWAGDETLTWRPINDVKRNYCSTPTIAEKKVEEHVPACDCTMCVVTKGHP